MSSIIVVEVAVKTIMSGLVLGVMVVVYIVMVVGIFNVIIYDMGGTSCDVGLIRGGVL